MCFLLGAVFMSFFKGCIISFDPGDGSVLFIWGLGRELLHLLP